MKQITQEKMKQLLKYEPRTGVFTWLKSKRSDLVGKEAGALDAKGYLAIKIEGKTYKAHRLAWLYVHGAWPENDIDHINGIRADNRIDNLRDASRIENNRNAIIRVDNKSGFKGVCWHKALNKWQANCRIDGKLKHLGTFDTAEAASAAYEEFAKSSFGAFYKEAKAAATDHG